MKSRILIFSLAYLPLIGGAEVALKEITERLPDYDFHLITARFSKNNKAEETIGPVKIYRVGWGCFLDKYLYFVLAYFKGLKLYQHHRYQIIWAMMANYAGLAALLFKWSHNVKYLLTLQSGDSDEFIHQRTWFWQPLYKQIYKQADYIQAISRWLENRAKSYGYQGKIDVVPNGVDIAKFSQEITQEEKEELLSQSGIGPNDKVIITVSRLVEKNGIGDLIESIKYLDERYKLLIIGTGKLEENLKLKTEELKLTDRVIFAGQKSHNELYKYLKISDVFIRPSLTEGFGNVFIEAMAAGLPVIATYVGGLKDFLIDGETGLVCQANNPQSIASQVKKLAASEELRKKIINQGLLEAAKYNWNDISFKINSIFKNL
ncbi:glycosyltransferase family 4 protein [Patescibacteria group bacterium]|nr:glycosyltransferase family 4 protein [Patescibacteria group bacterium]